MSSGKEGGDFPHPLSVTCGLFTVCLLVYPVFLLGLIGSFFLIIQHSTGKACH